MAGVVGDPYFIDAHGNSYEFKALPGKWYTMAADASVKVCFRVATVQGDQAKSYLDAVSVVVPDHKVYVSGAVVQLDGKPMVSQGAAHVMGSGNVRWWIGAGGESRVDVSYGVWRVAVIQDPGTDTYLHAVTSPIHGVLHLGLFVDAMPSVNVSGLVVEGGPDVDPAGFEAPGYVLTGL